MSIRHTSGKAVNKGQKKFYEKWKWDTPLEVEQQDGSFDLSDTQTTFLEAQGLSQDQFDKIETQFIDDLYGTTEGQTIIDGQNVELTQGQWQSTYFDDQAALADGTDVSIWGLDIRRTMKDEDGATITASDPEYYEHLTRGEVDWAGYQNDPKYSSVWSIIGEDKDKLTSDDYTDSEKISWIRKADFELANPYMENKDNQGWGLGDKNREKPKDWEGKVDENKIFRDKNGELYIDGKQQQTLLDLYNSPDGRLSVNSPKEQDDIKERRVIGRPNIPGVTWTPTGKGWDKPSLTNPAKIKLPRNIKGLFRGGKPTGGTK